MIRRRARTVVLLLLFSTWGGLGCGGASSSQGPGVRTLPPTRPEAARLFARGVKLLERGRLTAARRRLLRAVKVDPNLWEAHYDLGVIARRQGDLQEARERFEAALAIYPQAVEPGLGLAEVLYQLGLAEEAAERLERLVREHPEHHRARVALAALLRQAGRYEQALGHARRVLVAEPSDVEALAEVGRVYRARDRLDIAALIFRKALDLVGDGEDGARQRARLHTDLGLVELKRGDTQLAFRHFEEAVAADPSYTPARLNQASVLLRAGDYEGALAAYQEVVERDEDSVDGHLGLGIAYRGLERYRKARRAYEQVLDLRRDHPDALFDLAVLYAEFLEKPGKARGLFERFLSVAPSNHPKREEAKRYVEDLPASSQGGGSS